LESSKETNVRKRLPNGCWFTLARIPREATDGDVQAFLYNCGLYVEKHCISVDWCRGNLATAAVVSLTEQVVDATWGKRLCKNEIAALVKEMLGDTELLGCRPLFVVPGCNSRPVQ
jgi:hypothetical protein